MSDYTRYTVSVNKEGEWRAYNKKTNNSHDDVVSKSRDKLVTQLKEKTGYNKHYRRRREWILCNDTIVEKDKKDFD